MNIITAVSQYLKLNLPADIHIKGKANKDATAKYWGLYKGRKLKRHLIHIYLGNIEDNPNERKLDTVIAHELIHAWQEEKGYKDIHGRSFKKMAAKLKTRFPKLGAVFDPEVDT